PALLERLQVLRGGTGREHRAVAAIPRAGRGRLQDDEAPLRREVPDETSYRAEQLHLVDQVLKHRHTPDRVEPLTQIELGDVGDLESTALRETRDRGTAYGLGHHRRRQIDADDVAALGSQAPAPAADAATDVQD